jgi:hypothetical protein
VNARRHPLSASPSRAALALACMAVMAARGAARADNAWSGRALVSYGGTSAAQTETRGLNQSYDGLARLKLTSVLDGQLQLRYDDSRSANELASGASTRSTAQLLQPRALLEYRLHPVDLSVGYDLALSQGGSNTSDVSRGLTQRMYGSAAVSPESLPSARLTLTRYTSRSLEKPGELRNTTGQLALSHLAGPVRMSQSTLATWMTDTRSTVSTRTVQPSGSVAYETNIRGASLMTSYTIAYTDTAQRSMTGLPVNALVEQTPQRGLYAITDQPGDTTGQSFESRGRLIDNDLEVSAGISVGGDAVPHQNIAIDMGRVVVLDALRLWLRTAGGFPVQYDRTSIIWFVYASNDGNLWTPIAEASSAFDDSLSRIDFTLPPTTGRYFKVVNFGVANPTEAFVTELEGLQMVQVDPRAVTRTTALLQSAFFSASAPVLPKLQLSTQGMLSRASQSSPRSTFGSSGWSLMGSATAGPFHDDRLSASVDHEFRGSDITMGGSRFGWQSSARAQYRVVDPVTVAAQAHRTMEEGAADRMDAIGGQFVWSATLLPTTLELSGTAGFDRVQTLPDAVETDRLSASTSIAARIWPSLTLSGGASVQTGEVRQPASAIVLFPQPPASRTYSGTASYRPHERLQLAATVSYLDRSELSGVTQQYRIAWNPFPGGSFRLGLSYDQSIDAINGNRLSRFVVLPSWQLNRHTSLDGSYSDTVRTRPEPSSHVHTFFVGLTVRT